MISNRLTFQGLRENESTVDAIFTNTEFVGIFSYRSSEVLEGEEGCHREHTRLQNNHSKSARITKRELRIALENIQGRKRELGLEIKTSKFL